MSQPTLVCPKCGAPIQLSAKVWLSLTEDGVFVPGFDIDFTSEDSQFYCANDHDLEQWACDLGLYDALRDWIEPRLQLTSVPVFGWSRQDLDDISTRPLDDDELFLVTEAIPNSSIPEALAEVIWACKNPANDREDD